MCDDVLFYLLINAGRAHASKRLFSAVDRNHPGAVGPIRKVHRAVRDDGVVLEVVTAGVDQLLAPQRFTPNPRAEHHRMTVGFHRFQLFQPLLDRELFLVIVILGEEVAMLATQVATISDIDRADGKLRQAKDEEFGYVAEFAEFSSHSHRLRHYAGNAVSRKAQPQRTRTPPEERGD